MSLFDLKLVNVYTRVTDDIGGINIFKADDLGSTNSVPLHVMQLLQMCSVSCQNVPKVPGCLRTPCLLVLLICRRRSTSIAFRRLSPSGL